MKIKNGQMSQYINSLEKFLNRSDMIGYAAARNTRFLQNQLIEYENLKDSIIMNYGEPELENGKETGRYMLSKDSPNFMKCIEEIDKYANIEHKVKVFKIPYSEVIGKLTGSEILDIDWMLEDSDTPSEE